MGCNPIRNGTTEDVFNYLNGSGIRVQMHPNEAIFNTNGVPENKANILLEGNMWPNNSIVNYFPRIFELQPKVK